MTAPETHPGDTDELVVSHQTRTRAFQRLGGPLRWRPSCRCGWYGSTYLSRTMAEWAGLDHAGAKGYAHAQH